MVVGTNQFKNSVGYYFLTVNALMVHEKAICNFALNYSNSLKILQIHQILIQISWAYSFIGLSIFFIYLLQIWWSQMDFFSIKMQGYNYLSMQINIGWLKKYKQLI